MANCITDISTRKAADASACINFTQGKFFTEGNIRDTLGGGCCIRSMATAFAMQLLYPLCGGSDDVQKEQTNYRQTNRWTSLLHNVTCCTDLKSYIIASHR